MNRISIVGTSGTGKTMLAGKLSLWVLRTYHRRRAEYPALLAALERRGAQVVELHSPKEADRWLARLTSQNSSDSI